MVLSLIVRRLAPRDALAAHVPNEVSFAAPYPGKIVPVNLAEVGNRLIAHEDAFLCTAMGTRISIAFNRRLGAGMFGGEGFHPAGPAG